MDTCVYCGNDFVQPYTGRPRITCSGSCRTMLSNLRRDANRDVEAIVKRLNVACRRIADAPHVDDAGPVAPLTLSTQLKSFPQTVTELVDELAKIKRARDWFANGRGHLMPFSSATYHQHQDAGLLET